MNYGGRVADIPLTYNNFLVMHVNHQELILINDQSLFHNQPAFMCTVHKVVVVMFPLCSHCQIVKRSSHGLTTSSGNGHALHCKNLASTIPTLCWTSLLQKLQCTDGCFKGVI